MICTITHTTPNTANHLLFEPLGWIRAKKYRQILLINRLPQPLLIDIQNRLDFEPFLLSVPTKQNVVINKKYMVDELAPS